MMLSSWQKIYRLVIALCVATVLTSCAALDFADPEAPTIKIEGVKAKKLGGAIQQLELALLIQNPNRFDLQIQGLNFTTFVNKEKLAKGSSDQPVIVPGLGEALLEVQVLLGITELLSQASKLITDSDTPLEYSIGGTVNLENWPSAIPFNIGGEYVSPLSE